MEKIKKLVYELVKKYETNSPIELCNKIGIGVCVTDLPETTKGFFYKENQSSKMVILLNEKLDKELLNIVCAHELGHALMHSNVNCIKEESNNSFDLKKFEKEADYFSFYLIEKASMIDYRK